MTNYDKLVQKAPEEIAALLARAELFGRAREGRWISEGLWEETKGHWAKWLWMEAEDD